MADKGVAPIIIKKKRVSGGHGAHGGAWKVAYADFVTAMMAFFLVMWLMGSDEETKQAISSYFNSPPNTPFIFNFDASDSSIHGDKSEKTVLAGAKGVLTEQGKANKKLKTKGQGKRAKEKVERLTKGLKESMGKEYLPDDVTVVNINDGVLVRVNASLFFRSGSALLHPVAKQLLDKVANIQEETGYFLEISGHTDTQPLHGGDYPSNWELSSARASTVLRYFMLKGIDSKNMRAVGYGDSRPLVKAEKPGDKIDERLNRRVEFVFSERDYHDFSAASKEPEEEADEEE